MTYTKHSNNLTALPEGGVFFVSINDVTENSPIFIEIIIHYVAIIRLDDNHRHIDR